MKLYFSLFIHIFHK